MLMSWCDAWFSFQLVFHAFGGTQFRDNIAIDDVRLIESGECPEGKDQK